MLLWIVVGLIEAILVAHPLIISYEFNTTINSFIVVNNQAYVSSTNQLTSLNITSFDVTAHVKTGPNYSSDLCNHDLSSCLSDAKLMPSDYVNKILHLTDRGMLTCGTINQGTCQLRSLRDLSLIENGSVSVAPNSDSASCVSLIDSSGKLFVAATYAFDTPYRESFPIVSSRLPPDYYVINSGSIEGEAAVYLRSKYRRNFHIQYINGFFHKHFVYFINTESKYLSSNSGTPEIVSKLIRFCKDDERYISYSEIELQCRGTDNRNFNVIISATMVANILVAAFTNESNRESVICIFPLKRIDLTFWYNIDRCRIGSGTVQMPHIGRNNKCINKTRLTLSEDTCALGVGSNIASDQIAVERFSFRITALDASQFDGIIVGVFGTSNGSIFKVELNDTHVEIYDELNINDNKSPVVKLVIVNENFYFAATERKLYKLSLSTCESYSNCIDCAVNNKDPLCGWCFLENKCTRRDMCQSNSIVDSCPKYGLAPIPSNISIDDLIEKIFVPIGAYKQFEKRGGFICNYNDKTEAIGVWRDDGILCSIEKSALKTNSESSNLKLDVFYSSYVRQIISKNITVYNCSSRSICSQCLSSQWKCHWCSKEKECRSQMNRCISESANNECLRFDETVKNNILIPDVNNFPITFPIINAENENFDGRNLYCHIIANKNTHKTTATVVDGYVYCDSMIFMPDSRNQSSIAAKVELLIDDSLIDIANATLYNCQSMAPHCSSCLALDPKWKCFWCDGSCKYVNQCSSPQDEQLPDHLCNRPVIESFEPTSGPIEGGTIIEIKGKDLGLSIHDVKDRIFVGSSKCTVLNYVISVKIVCQVEAGNGSQTIRLRLGQSGRRYVDSDTSYHFVDPQPTSIYPMFGPVSGGTKLTIYGSYLRIGTKLSIAIGNHECLDGISESETSISCRTKSSGEVGFASPIRISIDKSLRILDRSFEYRHDPIVHSIEPQSSYISGGRVISVQGQYLDSVLNPKLFLLSAIESDDLISNFGECRVHNATLMFCQTPKVISPQRVQSLSFGKWPIGFLMDDVQDLRNMGEKVQLNIVPDPHFEPLDGVQMHVPGQLLVLIGNHLSHGATASEYFIYIGTSRCEVVLIDNQQIMCRATDEEPPATDEKGNQIETGHPLLTVIIGSLRFELGFIEYEFNTLRMSFGWYMILMFVLLVICLITVMVLCFVYSKKKNQREREYKRIQLKMEHLECNVRNECKQAFAELQTDVADINMAIDGDCVPFQDYSEFVNRLMFRDRIIGGAHLSTNRESFHPLREFTKLLLNKRFIFLLVQAVENNPSCSLNERSHVSSLIIGSLMDDMAYCSEIVLSLLHFHMNNCIKNKSAELIFRQSGSVVEKLFAYWFSICIFDDLKSDLGKTVYFVYKSLKCQIEKGPVDAINSNARYSLNEQKLLREPIDATLLHLFVIPLDIFDKSPVVVRVLSCDSILQVKLKLLDTIYKNQSFSSRITTEQFDLEWHPPQSGAIKLLDYEHKDHSKAKDILRLNRISDYNLPNNAFLAMQPTRSYNCCLDDEQSNSTNSGMQCAKFYHLEKLGDFADKIDYTIPSCIPEVYLTRLLTSKGTIQTYLNDLFESIIFMNGNKFPFILKYTFDFLDNIVQNNNINDITIINCWKTNVWVLRFWVNLLSNVDLILDVQRTNPVDSSLATVAQTLIDIFSSTNYRVGKESPSSKILFIKEIDRYRPFVTRFYQKIQRMPTISASEFFTNVDLFIQSHPNSNFSFSARSELLSWLRKKNFKLFEILSMNNYCDEERKLASQLQKILRDSSSTIDNENNIYATVQ